MSSSYTVKQLADKRYSGKFVMMVGMASGVVEMQFTCFNPIDGFNGNTYNVFITKKNGERNSFEVPGAMSVRPLGVFR